ncbi:MAG: DUF5009 domain-containing protein [Flavobacterium sp.]|nr:MAG: DUF5009 domain-containing protein [Flavobacterium sp.]
MTTNKPERLLSLDFFRGLTVASMILVNNPGSWGHIYAQLAHAEWNGCTPTDLVFPFFLFIVGVSIAYAMGSKKLDPSSHNKTILKALKRALTLFGLGLLLAIFPRNFSTFDLVDSLSNLRIGYPNLEKETNLGAWLDRTILTEAHLWKSAKTWDPEGILSTLPAIATGLFGVLVGVYLKRKDIEPATKIAWLFSVGVLASLAGLLWDLQFPINKSLWTSSYVLYTGGLATIILALSYWIIDINKYNRFTKPFVVYGVNAITVFFVSGLMPRLVNMIKIKQADGNEVGALTSFYQTFFVPYFSPINASLAYAIAFIAFFYVILWVMYKKNIIIKV